MEGEEPLLEWSFTQHRASAKKAKQAAAQEAVTFLRSRFRSILYDSPWSSVPHYHSHVDEEEEAVHEDDAEGGSLFGYTHWYGDINY